MLQDKETKEIAIEDLGRLLSDITPGSLTMITRNDRYNAREYYLTVMDRKIKPAKDDNYEPPVITTVSEFSKQLGLLQQETIVIMKKHLQLGVECWSAELVDVIKRGEEDVRERR